MPSPRVGNVLRRFKVDVDDKGPLRPQSSPQALDSASRLSWHRAISSALPPGITDTLLTITEMRRTPSPASPGSRAVRPARPQVGRPRRHAQPRHVHARARRRRAMKVSVHAAAPAERETGAVGFSCQARVHDLSWFAFVAKPWGRGTSGTGTTSRRLSAPTSDLKTAFLTFSPGVNR